MDVISPVRAATPAVMGGRRTGPLFLYTPFSLVQPCRKTDNRIKKKESHGSWASPSRLCVLVQKPRLNIIYTFRSINKYVTLMTLSGQEEAL